MFQGFDCSSRKAVHDLSLEHREIVWSLSTENKKLKRVNLSTRGMEKVNLWFFNCYTKSKLNSYIHNRKITESI